MTLRMLDLYQDKRKNLLRGFGSSPRSLPKRPWVRGLLTKISEAPQSLFGAKRPTYKHIRYKKMKNIDKDTGKDYVTATLVLIALAPVLYGLYWVAVIVHFI